MHEVGRGVGRAARIEGAGEAGQDGRDHADAHLVALDVVAEESRPILVLADRDEDLAEMGLHEHAAGEIREEEVHDDEVVDPHRRVDGDAGQDLGGRQALDAVGAAERLRVAEERVDHLGEDQRQEREVDAAAGRREVAHRDRIGPDDDDGEREAEPERQDAALEEHGGRVRPEAEERGMAEGHEAGVPDQEVEAHGDRAEEQGVEREQHVVLRHPRRQRQRRERREDHRGPPGEGVIQGRLRARRTRAAGRSGPRS